MKREKPNNLSSEPDYPMHETVTISFKEPDWVVHQKSELCKIEYPHKMKDCKEFEL